MGKGKFGTAVNCMDGRAQAPIIEWMRKSYRLDYIDMVTEPGADRLMGEGSRQETEPIKAKVFISVKAHGSRVVAVVGHDDCAGNPVGMERHLEQIRKGMAAVEGWGLDGVRVVGLWLGQDGVVERVAL